MYLFSPLEQFEISSLIPIQFFSLNFTITNITIFLFITLFTLTFWFSFSLFKANLVPHAWQSIKEILYNITLNLVKDNLGTKGEYYFPFIFLLHMFLLTCNLIGMVPYGFTLTSHIIFTFGLAFSIFFAINFIGLQTHGIKFFNIFLPPNVPLIIVPLIITIEIISYFVKVFTLSIRLFANMTSGHTLLKIVSGFAWTMLLKGGFIAIFHIIPLGLLIILILLEIGIAILQAYVFTLLTCIYLNDVLELH